MEDLGEYSEANLIAGVVAAGYRLFEGGSRLFASCPRDCHLFFEKRYDQLRYAMKYVL